MPKEIGVMLRILLKQCGKCFKKKSSDYVISTGMQYSVKDFVNFVLQELHIKFKWKGSGINSKCYNKFGNA